MTDRFWLLEWMESYEVKKPQEIQKLLSDRNAFNVLKERAAAASEQVGEFPKTNNPIVGGRGLDLSGELTGADTEELIKEVDQIFGTVWHYFDEVVVEGFAPRRFMLMCRDGKYDLGRERALTHCQLLLHLRTIGALDSVVFRQKPDPCIRHGNDKLILDRAGLARIMDDGPSIIRKLQEGRLITFICHYDHFHYEYEHPLVGRRHGAVWIDCDDDAEEGRIKHAIAQDIFELFADYAAADVAVTRALSAPLAIASPLQETILGNVTDRPGSGDRAAVVAIELGLPILHGVSARDLIRIRDDEADAFERFRSALRAAINESVKRANGTEDGTKIAADVVDEFLLKGLHDIDQRLTVARKVCARKSITNISVGTIAVVTGLLAGLPLLLPAGIVLGLGAAGIHYTKLIEDKGEVELSDMYFLWKLQNLKLKL